MKKKGEWQRFFDGHAPIYMQNVFTANTVAEVDFLLQELALPPGSAILDIGCGTGRHTIELSRRGYSVTGVDLSEGMLAQARKAADEAGVAPEWIHTDATQFRSGRLYDAAICLCEGAFTLLNLDDDPIGHDLAIARNIHAALKPGAGFILTALSAFRCIRAATTQDLESGKFDPVSMVETFTMEWDSPAGKQEVLVRERSYVPTELALLLRLAGFEVKHIWGGTAGNWGRRPLDLDEIEMMVVARRLAGEPQVP
jgi:SAM-dependent methyltransferase